MIINAVLIHAVPVEVSRSAASAVWFDKEIRQWIGGLFYEKIILHSGLSHLAKDLSRIVLVTIASLQ